MSMWGLVQTYLAALASFLVLDFIWLLTYGGGLPSRSTCCSCWPSWYSSSCLLYPATQSRE